MKKNILILVLSCLLFISSTASTEDILRNNKNPLEAANLLIIEGQFEDAERFILWILKDPQAPEALRENLYYFLGLSLSGQKKI